MCIMMVLLQIILKSYGATLKGECVCVGKGREKEGWGDEHKIKVAFYNKPTGKER